MDVKAIVANTNYRLRFNSTTYTCTWGTAPTTAQEVLDVVNAVSGLSSVATLTADKPSTGTAIFTLTSVATGASASIKIQTGNQNDFGSILNFNTGIVYGTDPTVVDETLEHAIQRTQNLIYYVGILTTEELSNAELESASDYTQTLDKILFYASHNVTDVQGVFSQIQNKGNNHTRCLLYTIGDVLNARVYAAVYGGRALSTNFQGNNYNTDYALKRTYQRFT